jgi:hypothetical protein
MTVTPPAGIRLRGGAPIPPPPSLGRSVNVTADGIRIGDAHETLPGRWVAVCGVEDCRRALAPRPDHIKAGEALRGHWGDHHPEDAA